MTTENVKKTQQQYFDNFVNLYSELAMLTEDVKQLTEQFKEDYESADIANLKKVAKLKAEQKVGDAVTKSQDFLEAVDTFTK